ncbi:putative glycosyltransferase EpsJ [Variovorax sp. WDL1]|nr:glycosyl transferase, family 2 [Variovorax sp. WDL1]PNG59500.1 putative glycosyltransferase EpsJ [Variovorax sp. B4]PNG60709.1 putative glycosyltransferase EpsJ [Variovorax sp. B2]VTV13385.1 putative glycosyltransferase EpsJ [Variovorax sp. WDL1]
MGEVMGEVSAAVTPAPARIENPGEIEAVVKRIYQLSLERTPSPEERQLWINEVLGNRMSVAGLVEAIAGSPEADGVRQRGNILPELANGRFIQFAYEDLLERSPMLSEVVQWDHWLSRQNFARSQLVMQLFAQRAAQALKDAAQMPVHDPNHAPWLGTDRFINIKEWQAKADEIGTDYKPVEPKRYASLSVPSKPEVLVSAIASLYRGGDYIEQFLENITSQTIFATHCELIIIDADSPENEASVIARYMERFPNIVYHRAPTRIGIYEAWNLGVELSKGRYLTNTNLDDLRRSDSFERQMEILEKFPFVDVVYQDFYYSFSGKESFAKTAAVGFKSEVPVITPYNLIQSNSPHNAPMWRRTLHDEVGLFDANFRSAGDYDFWLRCVQAGKTFFKVNDPHVVYFVNPEGLSTQPNTRGIDEANRITKRHGHKLLSSRLLSSEEDFMHELTQLTGVPVELSEAERASPAWRYTAAQRALRLHSAAARGRAPA